MSDKNINQMDFKELREEVQMLRDELALMQRKYEDILYNLDNENFSSALIKEKDDMKAEIKITADEVSSKVSSEQFDSMISQTDGKIAMMISKNISAKFVSDVHPNRLYINEITEEQKGMICEHNGNFYYFNNISELWEICPYQDEVHSLFEQTVDGFNLVGIVAVSGKIIAKDSDTDTFSQMSETGLDVYINGSKKIGMGYYADETGNKYNFPYITLGAGTNNAGDGIGCIYKLENGLWIGDASITKSGGKYPGGKDTLTNISSSHPQATGIFIDLENEKNYRYTKGVPKEMSVAVFG